MTNEELIRSPNVQTRPAAKSWVQECPNCKVGWPVVQAFWVWPKGQYRRRIVALCCTGCAKVGCVKEESTDA